MNALTTLRQMAVNTATPAGSQPNAAPTDGVAPSTLQAAQSQLTPRLVTSAADPAFNAGYALIGKMYPADQMDSKECCAEQLDITRRGEWGANTYRFLALEDAGGRTRSVIVFNYLADSSVAFQNYAVPASAEAVDAMQMSAMQDAGRAGKPLFGMVLEADQHEVQGNRAAGYRLLEGVDYMQPPVGRGSCAVPLPLMLKIADENDPSLVKENGRIVGIRTDKVRQIVQDMYATVYEKDLVTVKGVPTTQYAARMLQSLEGQDYVKLS